MIKLNEITKVFKNGRSSVTALDKLTLDISKNSFTLLKGPSGCGKSTLLFTIGGMLKPDRGEVLLSGKDIYKLSEIGRRKLTASMIGFVFQSYHLLPYLTVIENINLQNRLPFLSINNEFVMSMTEELQLKDRLHHKPSQLSIGKQRVALIRSLAAKPEIVLADEPTGNLDPENSEIVLLFLEKFRKEGGSVVMVSHSSEADKIASRIINMKEGMVIHLSIFEHPKKQP